MHGEIKLNRIRRWRYIAVDFLLYTIVIWLMIQEIMRIMNHDRQPFIQIPGGEISGIRISEQVLQSQNFECSEVSDIDLHSSGIQRLALGIHYFDSGFRLMTTGFHLLVSDCWFPNSDFWFLTMGFWLLNSFF